MIRAIAALIPAVLLAGCSPPAMLNGLDRVYGGSGATSVAEAVSFGSHGQTLDVWSPPGPAATPRPVLIWFYGGGWVKGDRAAYGFAARAFAARGYVVVVPDYRKVPAVRFPAFLEDGAQAVRWARDNAARFGGDPRRIALAGHSAGAYTVAMLALDRRWLVNEGVEPAVIRAGVGLSGPYDFYPFTSPRSIAAFAGAPDPVATQPISFVRRDAPPLLLITSTGDTVVRPRNAESLGARLTAAGGRVSVKSYPKLSHEAVVMALSRPFRGKAPVLDDSVAFLDAAMGQPASAMSGATPTPSQP